MPVKCSFFSVEFQVNDQCKGLRIRGSFLCGSKQDSEAAKKMAQSKLSEYQNDMERLRGEIKATTKFNRKLQTRVQTFEKKLELQQIKEQHTSTIFDQTNEALEKTKLEQEAHASIVNDTDRQSSDVHFCSMNIPRSKRKTTR